MSLEYINIKAVLVKKEKTEERQASVLRTSFGSLLSKSALLNFILKDLFMETTDIDSAMGGFRIERKSKKHKKFVSLECSDDFKELMRSLKVKNHVKLVVYWDEITEEQKESTVTDALDQVKKLVGELQKSEVWEILRSFTTAYNNQIAPDGCPITSSTQSKENNAHKDDNDIDIDVDENDDECDDDEEVVHQFVACDSCHPGQTFDEIHGRRYKCIVCNDFDLCEKCYSSKVKMNGHLPGHPMLVIEDSSAYREYTCAILKRPQIIFDCWSSVDEFQLNAELSDSFEPSLRQIVGSTCPALLSEVDQCLERSRKYSELESLVPGSSDKFEALKCKIIRADPHGKSNEITDELPSKVSFTKEDQFLCVVKNTSGLTIPMGDIIVDFLDAEGKSLASRKYKLSHDLYSNGEFSLSADSELKAVIIGAASVHMSLQESSNKFVGEFGDCVKLNLLQPEQRTDNLEGTRSIELTVVPKGTSLSQIILANKSDKEFSCDNLNFEIVNCFGKSVASVSAHKKHALLPGRFAKFNILVNSTHFKYPFKLSVSNDYVQGSCELSLKSLTALIYFSATESKENQSTIKEGMKFNADVTSSGICDVDEEMCATIVGNPQVEGENIISDDIEDDFDIISMSDADDVAADFEILSNVNSCDES